MHVTVISPEAAVFDGEADSVVAPAFDGDVGILPNHAPLMTVLGTGVLTVKAGGVDPPLPCARRISSGRQEQRPCPGRTGPRRCRCCEVGC